MSDLKNQLWCILPSSPHQERVDPFLVQCLLLLGSAISCSGSSLICCCGPAPDVLPQNKSIVQIVNIKPLKLLLVLRRSY